MKKLKLPTTSFGKQIELNGLSVFPLYLKSGLTTRVKSGLVMIDKKLVDVKEVSDAGSVPTLYVRNDSDHHVLFVEGDQLVGAKQNRICNSSVLMAPQSFAEIPVSCVEQGRWAKKSAAFASSSNAATPEMRKILKQSKREARQALGCNNNAENSLWNQLVSCWIMRLYTKHRKEQSGKRLPVCKALMRFRAKQVQWRTCLNQNEV